MLMVQCLIVVHISLRMEMKTLQGDLVLCFVLNATDTVVSFGFFIRWYSVLVIADIIYFDTEMVYADPATHVM